MLSRLSWRLKREDTHWLRTTDIKDSQKRFEFGGTKLKQKDWKSNNRKKAKNKGKKFVHVDFDVSKLKNNENGFFFIHWGAIFWLISKQTIVKEKFREKVPEERKKNGEENGRRLINIDARFKLPFNLPPLLLKSFMYGLSDWWLHKINVAYNQRCENRL